MGRPVNDMGKPAKVHCMLGFDADEIAAAIETICRDRVASMIFSILIGLLLGSYMIGLLGWFGMWISIQAPCDGSWHGIKGLLSRLAEQWPCYGCSHMGNIKHMVL